MDQAGSNSNVASSSGMPSAEASSFFAFSPQEYAQFKAQVTHQLMLLQRMYQELRNAFTIEQSKTQELMNTITALKEQIKPMVEKLANLQKFVAKITDENVKLQKSVEDQCEETRKDGDERRAEVATLRTMIENFARSVNEISLRAVAASGASGSPLFEILGNFARRLTMLENMTRGFDASRLRRASSETSGGPIFEQMHSNDMDSAGFQVLETTNYDGKLIWKIQDFRRRQDDAKRGGALSIYSQPFYTSRYGYKMCLRIYLNGDGMGRNTHISLFFVLMQGDYDALLPFPFKQKVSLYLLDQGPRRRHLTDTFRPDPASSSFQRPISDKNIASGCPMFVAQETLNNSTYMVDDTIFIRAIIDTTDVEIF